MSYTFFMYKAFRHAHHHNDVGVHVTDLPCLSAHKL